MNKGTPVSNQNPIDTLEAAVEHLSAELDRARAAQRAAETRYRDLLEGSTQGILVHRKCVLLYANPAMAAMLGYDTPEEFLALPSSLALVCPHDRERLRGYMERRLAGATAPAVYRFDALDRDGGHRVLENRVRTIEWYGETAIQATVVDVTAEQRTRAALERSHRLLDAVINTIPERLLVRDRDGNKLLVNRARSELLGLTPEEFLRLPEKYPLLRPEDIAETEREDRRVLDEGCHIERQVLRRRPDGREEWIHYRLVPLRDPNGAIRGTLSLSADISQSRQAEQALRASEARFRDFAELGADWLWETDAQLRFSYASPGFQGATGVSPERIQGRTRRELYAEDLRQGGTIENREAFAAHLDLLDAHRSFHDTEIVRVEADGRRLVFVASGKARFDEDGNFLGYRGITRDLSAQRNADAAIARQAAELDALYRALPDLCFLVDAEGAVLDFKPGAELAPYLKPEDFLGKRMEEVLPQPAATRLDEAVRGVAASGEGRTIEYALPYPDGDHHYEARIVALTGRRCFTLVRDITDRVRAEEELQRRDQRMQRLFATTGDGFILADRQGRIVDVNPAYVRITGYSREELIGKNMRSLEPAASPAEVDARFEAIRARRTTRFETRHRHRNGTPIDLDVSLTVLDDPDGPLVAAFVRDLSELKAATAAVAESEMRFRDFAETAADWFWEMGPDLRITYVSGAAFEKVMGYPPNEAIGRARGELFEPQNNDPLLLAAHLRDLEAHRAFRNVELRWRNPRSGALVDVAIDGKPLHTDDGTFLGYRGTARNVSTVRRAERQREQLKTQLAQAQKLEALGQLSGVIAHDFNNILGSILGYSSLAQQRYASEIPQPLARYLEEIRHAGERARDVIGEILAYARGLPGERKTVDAAAIIESVTKLLRSTLPSSMPLEIHCAEGLPALHVDAVQMDQVLLNLGVNARDAMGESGTLTIAAERLEIRGDTCASCKAAVDGEYVAIRVADCGPGIEPDVLERIFEPFYTTKDQGSGSGMGLAIAHSVIHEHDGHVLVTTTADTGTAFTLLLPPASGTVAAAVPAPSAAPTAHRAGTLDGRLDGVHILVVDDDPSMVAFLGEFLRSAGCRTTLQTDSLAALEALRAAPTECDLLLTDRTMPELTGAELATAARVLRPGLPIIICTGYAQKAEALRDGAADAVIAKPVDTEALLDTLTRLLRR